MKTFSDRIISMTLVFVLIISFVSFGLLTVSAESSTSGTCGNYLTWNFDESTGTLTIICSASYEQKMYDYSNRKAPWYDFRDSIKTVIADDKVSSVGTYAFTDCEALESVYMPAVNNIGDYAFFSCSSLKNVELSSDFLSYCRIGKYAFAFCSSLSKMCLPFRDVTICEKAFYYCDNLKTIGIYTSANIEADAFSDCSQISSLYMLNNGSPFSYGTTISNTAFSGVNADVYYYDNYTPTQNSIYGGKFTYKKMTSGIVGYNAYWSYDQENDILTITGTGKLFRYISGDALPWYSGNDGYSRNAKTIIIEDGITEIPSYSFEYMSNVESVTLPNTLLRLYPNAFNDCKSLTEIVIPSSVEYIDGRYYWNRCPNLNDVYYVGTEQEWNEIYDLSNSYIAERITPHFLVYHPSTISCVEAGYPAHYEFDGTAKEGIFYDLNKAQIPTPEPTMIEHSFSEDWTADDKCHRHICTLCKIADSDKSDHVYDNSADSTCNVCGYIRVTDPYYLGDVDHDGEATVIDATYIQRYDAYMFIPISEDVILLCGDIEGNEEVGVIDATYIQRYDAGFRVPYPIGKPI